MTRTRREPSAAARTLCLICGGCCAGTCDRARPLPASAALDVAVAHAAERVAELVEGLGLVPAAAVKLVARRMALGVHDVLVRARDVRRAPAWWTGPAERPTSRPTRAIDTDLTLDSEKGDAA